MNEFAALLLAASFLGCESRSGDQISILQIEQNILGFESAWSQHFMRHQAKLKENVGFLEQSELVQSRETRDSSLPLWFRA
jgi:hypothetical protein